jgi:hypothetical protein
VCVPSIWSSRSGARSAHPLAACCARRVDERSFASFRRCASSAVLPGRGPFDAAPNARAGGSRSREHGPRSSTTRGRERSSASGRSVVGADLRERRRLSSRRSSRSPRRRCSLTFRVTRSVPGSAAMSHRARSRERWRASGERRLCTFCIARTPFRASVASRSQSGAGTSVAASSR